MIWPQSHAKASLNRGEPRGFLAIDDRHGDTERPFRNDRLSALPRWLALQATGARPGGPQSEELARFEDRDLTEISISSLRPLLAPVCGVVAPVLALPMLLAAAPAVPAPFNGRCPAGKPALQIRVGGFRDSMGKLIIRVYGGDPNGWLGRGSRLNRIDAAVPRSGPYIVCVPVSGPGNYGVAVHHDTNGDSTKDFGDGAGFSRNPPLTLMRLKPEFQDVFVTVAHAPLPVNIIMNYRYGIVIRPVDAQ